MRSHTCSDEFWVVVSGVHPFANTDSGLSHMRALQSVMKHHGADVDRDWLLGVSGEAFCNYYHPDGTFLTEHVHSWDSALAALQAYGFTGEWHHQAGPDTGDTLNFIEGELAAGRPVVVPGAMPAPDGTSHCGFWFVASGLNQEERRWRLNGTWDGGEVYSLPEGDDQRPEYHPRWYGICRTFDGKDGHYGPKHADCPVLAVRPAGEAPDDRTLVIQALERAVALCEEKSTESTFGWGAGTYLAGDAALLALCEDLRSAQGDGVEEFKKLNPVKGNPFRGIFEELQHLPLLDARRKSAATFCRQASEHVPAEAGQHLNEAALCYGTMSDAAAAAYQICFGDMGQLGNLRKIAHEGTYENNDCWDNFWASAERDLANPSIRKKMAEHLRQVRDSNLAACKAIARALEATS
jgi:hypothetical protein